MVRMLNVSILRGATAVGASQDSLEMDTTVQVRSTELLYRIFSQFCALGNCRHQ